MGRGATSHSRLRACKGRVRHVRPFTDCVPSSRWTRARHAAHMRRAHRAHLGPNVPSLPACISRYLKEVLIHCVIPHLRHFTTYGMEKRWGELPPPVKEFIVNAAANHENRIKGVGYKLASRKCLRRSRNSHACPCIHPLFAGEEEESVSNGLLSHAAHSLTPRNPLPLLKGDVKLNGCTN